MKPMRPQGPPRGQAMLEYTIIAHAILIGGTLLMLPMISLLIEALNEYYESLYFVLRSAAM